MNPLTGFTNRLAGETSPYLLQHAHNPVDWHPWGEEALALARREGKPVLLSIGYSACHWCHVMAHESFEDAATAERMNALFVNIKVDREERPDLDKIYQLSHQLLSRSNGGWPLTVFLDPRDLLPFFTGTYFPKAPRYQLPGFVSVLEKVSEFYQANKDNLGQNKRSLQAALNSVSDRPAGTAQLDNGSLTSACQDLAQYHDKQWGGFGGAPKFPHVSALDFLLRHAARTGDGAALQIALHSLRQMALGGLYDQLGGGFCRYSVDAAWNIPHFEKMLYDNGPLLALYSQAWQLTGEVLFRRVALETAAWAMREMRSPEGGFFSSLDADSEGEEGRYYVWEREAVQALLTEEEFAVVDLHYGLAQSPNFEGHWHLYMAMPLDAVATALGMDEAACQTLLDAAKRKLLASREARVRPGCDDKILTAWNALMVKGLAVAGRAFGRADLTDAACQTLAFIRQNLCVDRQLRASWKGGRARFPAYLDDHAFLLDASLEVLQCRWDGGLLGFAVDLAEALLSRFEDQEAGGFYFTAHDHEALICRPKSMTDESMASGNGVAAFALDRLGHWLGEPRYNEAARRVLQAAAPGIHNHPLACGAVLAALEQACNPPQTVVIRGEASAMADWLACCQVGYHPNRTCFGIPGDAAGLPGLLAERKPGEGVTAYLCAGTSCLPPINRLDDLQAALKAPPVETP